MNVIISCYKYESLTSVVKGEEFMGGVKFLFPNQILLLLKDSDSVKCLNQ